MKNTQTLTYVFRHGSGARNILSTMIPGKLRKCFSKFSSHKEQSAEPGFHGLSYDTLMLRLGIDAKFKHVSEHSSLHLRTENPEVAERGLHACRIRIVCIHDEHILFRPHHLRAAV